MNRYLFAACLTAAPLFTACSATKNPTRPERPSNAENLQVAATKAGARVTPEPADEAVAEGTPEAASALTVAYIAGTRIDVRELLDLWLFRDSPGVHDMLGELVVSRFTLAEAARLSLRIPDEELELGYQRGLAALQAEVERVRPGETVDDYLVKRRGVDPVMYRERLREQSARALIAERVVRAWLLSEEHVIARAIICDSREQVAEVETALKDGAEFDLLARELSVDPDGKTDGMLPPITRTDSVVSRLSFVTPVGEIGGPIEEGGRYLLLKVEARPEPLVGDWRTVGALVEQSLEARPVEEVEWLQWEEAMFSRYQVDTSPFLKLVGEPTR